MGGKGSGGGGKRKGAGRKPTHLARNGWAGQRVLLQRMVGDENLPIRDGRVVGISGGAREPRALTIVAGAETWTITFLPKSSRRK